MRKLLYVALFSLVFSLMPLKAEEASDVFWAFGKQWTQRRLSQLQLW